MGFALLAFMMEVRNKNLKRKADIFNRLRIGMKVFKGLAMNSLSQACLQVSETTPSNQIDETHDGQKSDSNQDDGSDSQEALFA